MIQNKELICVNQVSGPLFIDIINTFSQQKINTLLFTGNVESTYTELLKEVPIKKSTSYVKKNIFLKLLTWSMFCIHLFFFLLFIPNKSKKKLLLVSNPPFNPWIGLFYKKCFNLSYSVLIYDVYPDILEHHGYLNSNSILLKMEWQASQKNYFLMLP